MQEELDYQKIHFAVMAIESSARLMGISANGSTAIVEYPLVAAGRNGLDFGKGFYLTSLENQEIIDRCLTFEAYREL